MARPKGFQREVVLDKALDLFWLQGYAATSLDQLTDAMGLGRGSLYNEFGAKHALFLDALDRYCALRLAELSAMLEQSASVRAGIAGLLRGMVTHLWSDPRRRGCFLVNSTAELASDDAAVAVRSAQGFERTVSVVQLALERGKANGELA